MKQLRPITSYLTSFDEQRREIEESFLAPEFELSSPAPAIIEAAPDLDSLAEEREKAREEIRSELDREFEAKLDEERKAFQKEREAFDQKLEAARATWVEQQGAKVADVIHKDIQACVENLRDALSRLLKPFLTHRALKQSLDDFVEAVGSVVADQANPVVELQGPADLLEVVCERLSREGVAIRATENDGADLVARINSTLIETRMDEWVRRLRDGE
ncbi:MAG TPA: hypothetical protein VIF34_12605 [Methylocystis sp.]|jgi:hypothetical protein